MLLRVINDNILIPHPYYPGLYHEEDKNERHTKI